MKPLLRRWLLKALARLTKEASVGIPALTYHAIDESGSPVSFPASYCRAQLSWLASRGYHALTASQAAAALSRKEPSPDRSVVLTFDDGFRSVREVAFPLLSEFGFVATVFCSAGYVGKQCDWERRAGIPAFDLMSWKELGFLAAQGWEIGGHTISHARLTALPAEKMREEISLGGRILEEQLGRQVASFAYPYGAFDQESTEAVAAAGFRSAWTMQPRINSPGCDLFTLGRFNCDRVRSDCPETAALAARVCLGGRYWAYALLTARRLRVRGRSGKGSR